MTEGLPSREAIAAHQLRQLRSLVAALSASNPFYGPPIRAAGITPEIASLDDFFRLMPFTRKEQIAADQQQHPPYGTNLTFPLGAYNRFTQTSATSGPPLRWLDTPQSWQWMLDHWKQVYTAADVTPRDCIYFAFSFGPFLGFWTAFEAACQMGCRSLPGGGLSSLARLNAIRENGANVLCCTPTYALHLGQTAAEHQIDLAAFGMRAIIVAGEPGGSLLAVREKIERAWPGAAVFDHHGMTEVGPVTYQCPGRPGTLIVMESSYIAEIIDPRGDRHVARGEVGELVLTTLGRIGSPLLRYRTGDLVREELGTSAMALAGGILGRVDDMVVVRGVNVYPAAVENLLIAMPEVATYQIEVDARGPMVELHLQIEPAATVTDREELAARVQSQFRAAFNLRVPVTVCAPGALPHCEMKSRRWLRKKDL